MKMEYNVGGQDTSLLDAIGNGEAAQQRPIVLHLTSLTFMELVENGEKLLGTAAARQDFLQSVTADSIKGLGQVYESCRYVLFSAFLQYLPQHEYDVCGPFVGPEPHKDGIYSLGKTLLRSTMCDTKVSQMLHFQFQCCSD